MAKEKVSNAKGLALLKSWIFFLISRATDRLFVSPEANDLSGVKGVVWLFWLFPSAINHSHRTPASLDLINILKKEISFPCVY